MEDLEIFERSLLSRELTVSKLSSAKKLELKHIDYHGQSMIMLVNASHASVGEIANLPRHL